MTPLRVLHAVRSDAFQGVEQFVFRLAVAQASHGHVVSVIGGADDRMRGPLERAGVRYEPASRTGEVIVAIRRRGREVDVVNTHMVAADVAAVAALMGRRDRPAVVSTRHFTRQRGRFRALPLDLFVRGTVDRELAISEAVAAAIRVPSVVVHTGVADRPIARVPREPVVLIAQRLQPEKRTDVALRAFASSGLAREGWSLDVAGDGAEASQLRALADTLGVSGQVSFLGFRSDLPERMSRAGLLIAPCPVEGLGLTILEAMASGLPVVAADAAGHREVLDGLDPRAHFTPNDADAAASALRLFAGDADARDALGAAGRIRQREFFSVSSQVAGTDAVYRAAIEARAARSGGVRNGAGR
ncbi:glycosyltransferase family 4 protein [Rathayibacter soli]|uniref:glycosyltransferase family 4 protein n=1 Tax=Rathayibacter soli TaxID=3144168 RepID=UPI0027E513EF|nr:glycosyltransferase family 4 protein [Glaciibacter superstes]